jgi:hypothetical protein
MNKLTTVSGYRRTVQYFTSDGPSAADDVRGGTLGTPAEFPLRQATELEAPTTDGPGYSRDQSLEAITARYEHCAAVTRHTLPRALADSALRALCTRLITEGRPEWIVLMTLANVVMNFRMNRLNGPLNTMPDERWRQRAMEEMRREERADDPAPSTSEIADNFEMQLALVTATIAKFWGLEINRETPDFDAVETTLKNRYHYWADDIKHSDFFAADAQ